MTPATPTAMQRLYDLFTYFHANLAQAEQIQVRLGIWDVDDFSFYAVIVETDADGHETIWAGESSFGSATIEGAIAAMAEEFYAAGASDD